MVVNSSLVLSASACVHMNKIEPNDFFNENTINSKLIKYVISVFTIGSLDSIIPSKICMYVSWHEVIHNNKEGSKCFQNIYVSAIIAHRVS